MFRSRIESDHSAVVIDFYHEKQNLGERIRKLVDTINEDVLRAKEKNGKNEFCIRGGLSCSEARIESGENRLKCILFHRVHGPDKNFAAEKLFGFKPYPDHDWIAKNWHHYVEGFENAFFAADVLIRLFMFPGFVCFDIEDIRSIFSNGPTISFPVSESCFEESWLNSALNHRVESELKKFFLIAPTPDEKPGFSYRSFAGDLCARYRIPGNAEFLCATYFSSSNRRGSLLVAG